MKENFSKVEFETIWIHYNIYFISFKVLLSRQATWNKDFIIKFVINIQIIFISSNMPYNKKMLAKNLSSIAI